MHGLDMAKRLLGKILVHVLENEETNDSIINTHIQKRDNHFLNKTILAGKIIETEYYDGLTDEACHAFHGKSKRNEVMFQEAGYLYVYLIYGIHYCANVVTDKIDVGSAVLLRAIEPVLGIEKILQNRNVNLSLPIDMHNPSERKKWENIANGPGKLTQAIQIRDSHNGLDLKNANIFISDYESIPESQIESTSRIGITKAKDLLWRFVIKK